MEKQVKYRLKSFGHSILSISLDRRIFLDSKHRKIYDENEMLSLQDTRWERMTQFDQKSLSNDFSDSDGAVGYAVICYGRRMGSACR